MSVKTVEDKLASFREYLRKLLHYQEAVNLMQWDLRTGAPKKGVPLRAEAIGTLSDEAFRRSTSSEMEDYLNVLTDEAVFETLSPVNQAIIRVVNTEFQRNKKIPADKNKEFIILTSQAESIWEEAKDTSNFELFRPYLEKIVAITTEFTECWGYVDNRYDTLLDIYEPHMTVQKLNQLFGDLRKGIVPLVQAIVGSGRKANLAPVTKKFDVSLQRQLSRKMLGAIGYDFAAGRLDETVHPFMTTINRFDNRVTTKFVLDDLRPALFGTIHEGGHALYEQGISTDLLDTPLSTGTSMGIHESQSRFYENMIGRSREFWTHQYKEVLDLFPVQFADVSLDDFYRAVNAVEPSLIRIEADEVTYNLHIMIRYEIEQGLINGDIAVRDLPAIWRAKMKEYLGIEPSCDAEGVLQDVHWSSGMFGYFPSYALGNLYAAQFRNTLAKERPNYLKDVQQGDLTSVREWLLEKIHCHGRMLTPGEIVQRVTGEELSGKYLIDYLNQKFRPLYGL